MGALVQKLSQDVEKERQAAAAAAAAAGGDSAHGSNAADGLHEVG